MCIRHGSDASHATAPGRWPARWIAGILAMTAGLLLAAAPAQAGSEPQIIRLPAQINPGMPTYGSLQHFKDRVEQASKGSLVIDIHHSGKLFSSSQTGPAVTSGVVEMGLVNLSQYGGTVPLADAFQMPFLFNTSEIGDAAAKPGSEICGLIDQALLTQAGSRVLWWVPLGQTVFLSRGVPLTDPEMIKGKTVRTFGPSIEAMVRSCGGIPKDIRGEAAEKAYENREVDVGMNSLTSAVGRKMGRFMDTITRTNHASMYFVVVINEKYWQSLTAEQRTVLSAAALSADAAAREITAEIEGKANKELAEGQGFKIADLTDDELRRWRVCSSEVLERFVEKAGPDGQELMLAYGRMRKGSGNPFLLPLNPIAVKRAPAAPR